MLMWEVGLGINSGGVVNAKAAGAVAVTMTRRSCLECKQKPKGASLVPGGKCRFAILACAKDPGRPQARTLSCMSCPMAALSVGVVCYAHNMACCCRHTYEM